MNEPQRKKIARRPPHPSQKETAEASSSLFYHALYGFLLSLPISLILMLISSLAAYFSPDPGALIAPLGVICALLTAFLGGFLGVYRHKHAALLCGVINASLLLALLLLLSLFFKDSATPYSVWIAILLHTALPVSSVTGAYLALPRNKKAVVKKKHR